MRCRELRRRANPAYLSRFPFCALPGVAPYGVPSDGVPGGTRMVSGVRRSYALPVLLWSTMPLDVVQVDDLPADRGRQHPPLRPAAESVRSPSARPKRTGARPAPTRGWGPRAACTAVPCLLLRRGDRGAGSMPQRAIYGQFCGFKDSNAKGPRSVPAGLARRGRFDVCG